MTGKQQALFIVAYFVIATVAYSSAFWLVRHRWPSW